MTRTSINFGLPLVLMLAPLTVASGRRPAICPRECCGTYRPHGASDPGTPYPHQCRFDARNATPPPRFEVRRRRAPNVLIVLLDDMGFGQSSAFGGPIDMPTVERLATKGSATTNSTRRRCARRRGRRCSAAATITSNNMGAITEIATGFPGKTGQRPNSVAPVAEMLRLNGYSTAAFGKSHETAAWEVSPPGQPTVGRPVRASTSSTASWAARPTNGRRSSMRMPGSSSRTIQLPLHDRHDQPGDRLDAVPEIADAG